MNWQNVIVYTIIVLCVLIVAYKLQKKLSKKHSKCTHCDCACEFKNNTH